MKNQVQFYSEQSAMAAHLYLPDNFQEGDKLPALILCNGFAGIKEMLLPAYAETFAAAGFIVLTFDYRGFGDSEGIPGNLVPMHQVADIRNAITYMQSLSGVDPERIGLWGTSYGGANCITAARDDQRVKCLVVQLAFASGRRVITGHMTEEEKEKLNSSLSRTWEKAVTKNRVMALLPNLILTDEQSREFYTKMVEQFPKLACKIPILTIRHTIEYNPEKYIGDVNVPVFILAAGKDAVNPARESEILFEKANQPKEYCCLKDASHYAVYEGDYFREAVTRQTAWFKKHL